MFCSKCGKENDDQAMFCLNCGNSLKQVAQETSVEQNGSQTVNQEQVKSIMRNSTSYTTTHDTREKYVDKIAIGASFILIIAMFLPYMKAEAFGMGIEVTLIEGDGIFFVGLAVAVIIFAYLKKEKFVFALAVAILALALFEVANYSNTINGDDIANLVCKRSSGYYLMIFSSIIIFAAPLIQKYGFKREW